jgi:ABC-type sugar transport system substrate-binding protein
VGKSLEVDPAIGACFTLYHEWAPTEGLMEPNPNTGCRLAFFSMDAGEHQELLREECVQTAARYGFRVRVFQADGDATKQVAQIQGCLREEPLQRPTVIIVSPVREVALLAVAHAAVQLGVGWVVLQRSSDYLDDLRREHPSLPIFAVLPDQHEVGRIQGRQVLRLLPGGGELVYVRGPLATSSAVDRSAGLHEVLQGTAVKMSMLTSDWTVAGGAQTMKEWARIFHHHRDVPHFVVGAQNDAMAMGARSALEELVRERPSLSIDAFAFSGCDGSPGYGRRLVSEGKLACTVVLPITSGRAVSELASMLRGGPRPPPSILLTPVGFPDPQALAPLRRPARASAYTERPPRR